jgi:hypothetical protein
MKRLYNALRKVEDRVAEFYKLAIDLHENESLRSLGRKFTIVHERYGSRLFYGPEGFYAGVSKCVERGDAWCRGLYKYPEHTFRKKGGKLVVKSHKGTQEMLELFPTLTIGTLEDRLVERIENIHLIKEERK